MSTVVLYSEPASYTTTDGHDIRSNSTSSYADAWAGANLNTAPATGPRVGQRWVAGPSWYVYQMFEQFDTSYIGSGATVSAATLEQYVRNDDSDTDFTVEARAEDFGGLPVTTGDWVAGADLSGKTLLATLATSGVSASAYNTFTDVALPANINKTGDTRIMFCSKEQTDNSAPTGLESLGVDGGHWINPPRLTITHSGSAGVLMAYADMSSDTSEEVYCADGTYSTARAGTGSSYVADNFRVGQSTGYTVFQTFIEFDTSVLDGSETITQVDLDIGVDQDNSAADFTIEARLQDFGGFPLTTGDFVAGADLSGKTLLATAPTSSISALQLTWTSESAFLTNINDAGDTRIMFCSKEQTDDSAPTAEENVLLAEEPAPRLIIQYTTDITTLPPVAATTAAGLAVTALIAPEAMLAAVSASALQAAAGAFNNARPDADVAAGSWTVEPLWSKVDEVVADGTVITDTTS